MNPIPAFPIWKIIPFLLVLSIPITSVRAQTADLDTAITSEEKAQFDQMLKPVVKIYNFVKYSASFAGAIFMLFAGISYMASGNDMRKRDQSKNMATFVVIGLTVIWAAPYAVNLLVSA